MTDPNKLSQSDILAAREMVKQRLTPAFVKAVDAGELDGYKLFEDAVAEIIRRREDEVEGE